MQAAAMVSTSDSTSPALVFLVTGVGTSTFTCAGIGMGIGGACKRSIIVQIRCSSGAFERIGDAFRCLFKTSRRFLAAAAHAMSSGFSR